MLPYMQDFLHTAEKSLVQDFLHTAELCHSARQYATLLLVWWNVTVYIRSYSSSSAVECVD
jgi:hypothetical protein